MYRTAGDMTHHMVPDWRAGCRRATLSPLLTALCPRCASLLAALLSAAAADVLLEGGCVLDARLGLPRVISGSEAAPSHQVLGASACGAVSEDGLDLPVVVAISIVQGLP